MSHSMIDLRGIFPPVPTPFNKTGAFDQDSLASHLEFLGSFDLAGYVMLGSNGEAVHLSIEERSQLLEATRGLIPENRLLIAGTGCLSTWQTIEASQRAAAIGVDAVLVLPPYYYRGRMTVEALRGHFHAVADAVTVPVILYNMPGCTGLDMDASTVAAIADHPNIVGIKDSGGDVAKLGVLHQQLGQNFQLLAGSASFLLPALSVGAVGGVLALANIAPAECLAIRDRVLTGDWNHAREIQVRLIEANSAVTSRWGVAGLKAAMTMMGLPSSFVRAPLLELKEPHLGELKSILKASQILASDQ